MYFLARNMMIGHNIFKLCFQPKNAKNMPILGVFHVTFKRDD